MDRLNQLRSEAGGSGDSTLDTSSPPSEAYLTANESSKYFSLLEDESSFNISKDAVNPEAEEPVAESPLIPNLSPIHKKSDIDSYKIGKQIEAANILSGGVNIFDDNENSYDGDELVIDDNAAEVEEKSSSEEKLSEEITYGKIDNNLAETIEDVEPVIPSKDTEVVLQIDGKNVDAIDIGNGLYLYRKDGQEELAAVQIIDDDLQQSSFKFLKVRENAEGNLEVYEEIEIEVPKEAPSKEGKPVQNMLDHQVKDGNKTVDELTKSDDTKVTIPQKEVTSIEAKAIAVNKEIQSESKYEVNLNGKTMKFSESRKSPVVGSYTPMTFHSTPNKEGIPLTKTMVDQQLHPSRHSDNVKKTIEVHTDSSKQRILETPVKNNKEFDETKVVEIIEKDNKENSGEIKEDQKVQDKEEKDKIDQECLKKNRISDRDENNVRDIDQVSIKYETSNVTSHEPASDKISSQIQEINDKTPEDEIEAVVAVKVDSESSRGIESNFAFVKNNPENPNSPTKDTNENKPISENENLPPVNDCVDNEQISVSNINNEYNKIDVQPNQIESEVMKKDEEINLEENLVIDDSQDNLGEPNKEVPQIIEPHNEKPINENIISQSQNIEGTNTTNKDVYRNTNDSKSNIEIKNQETTQLPMQDQKLALQQVEAIQNEENNQNNRKVDAESKIIITSNIIIDSKEKSDPTKSKEQSKLDENSEKSEITQVNDSNQTNVDETKKGLTKINENVSTKPVNNNNSAVPFGKWTEANRQEFLNKIKETKIPTNNSNTKQIKQTKDLNRRDILQKIDSQRQQQSNNAIAKVQEQQKLNLKSELSAFVKSVGSKPVTKIPVKDRPQSKLKPSSIRKNTNDEAPLSHPTELNSSSNSNTQKKESLQRREINNQALIDRTIEDIINRVPPVRKTTSEERKQNVPNPEGIEKQKGMTLFGPLYHARNEQSVTLDEIEMKMNELHGIPFVERPAHELPQKFIMDTVSAKNENIKCKSNQSKASTPSQISFVKKTQPQTAHEEIVNIDSDEEIIEHEPITGDVNPKKKSLGVAGKALDIDPVPKLSDASKKDVIITEKDFDKFFRRNSVTYENCLTVNFDGKEPHNVVQTVIEKDVAPKKLTRNEVLLAESKAKSTHKLQMLQARHNNHPTKTQSLKYQTPEDDSYGKNYQSKLQIAYQSALTAKRQKESPITIIEEKPVKVVFMDSNVDFVPCQLNVQGEKLSPVKQFTSEVDTFTHSTTDSLDSDILDNFDSKCQDDTKTKTKHQRKQVLTPVETPEMELIEPDDLGIEVSPKKKRKIEEKPESPRNHVPKKSYLLGRTNTEDKIKTQEIDKISFKEITNHNNSFVGHSNPISAIDNLVKAAELLETQAENTNSSTKTHEPDPQPIVPVKRGRGRPRKYPLPDGEAEKNKVPSPQKKPRLIDAKVVKRQETDEDDTSDDEIIRENWTMGPSPNRSESDKRRLRESQESDQSMLDLEEQEVKSPRKRKSKESISKSSTNSDELLDSEVIVIEDTPLKEKPMKHHVSRKSMVKTKIINKLNNNLVCEICGKTFRQSSYLAHHKLQHKNDEVKKQENDANVKKSIFSCEVCKKEFRKLHHLVQHRIIHNPNSVPTRTLRKNSSEHSDNKVVKDSVALKQNEDQSAGFRCEPCDKSFRKLHHLVEHRETHDGINRQKANEVETAKPVPIHRCDICDKTFKKLQLLNEHKDQHLETCSEKSDDKSVKSSLSTKDIIHECSLCYMVFPNEHSLNKHTVICLRKKKQSAAKAKQAALKKESEGEPVDSENTKSEENHNDTHDSLIIVEDPDDPLVTESKNIELDDDDSIDENKQNKLDQTLTKTDDLLLEQKEEMVIESIKQESSNTPIVSENILSAKPPLKETLETPSLKDVKEHTPQIQLKAQPKEENVQKVINKIIPKKKTPVKDRIPATVTKRQKTVNVPLPVIENLKEPLVESSDDDDVRYMLNPDFNQEETVDGKNFMNVKAKKRNSLQIERPNSKDLVKRRISLQHPPKLSRLKNKIPDQKPTTATTSTNKPAASKIEKQTRSAPTASTDSDDSETKYAFPETIKQNALSVSEVGKKPQRRKSLVMKRKSLSAIAKRKSLGKAINSKHKLQSPSTAKQIKKRTTEVEHRCDCGKLFSSAALLSRHTTLDHTPPRIRRRRSPAPEPDNKTVTKEVKRKSVSAKSNNESADTNKPGVLTRKSSMHTEAQSNESRKSLKSVTKAKSRKSIAHKGVPVPDKMRKFMEKSKI
ncbi:interaptin-like isoform X2 [Battus philenor]|uniref:interaptin-like isoform X2 n=1 Tax=Battus philenor TaxID=42288 RepID=UPI0035CF423C